MKLPNLFLKVHNNAHLYKSFFLTLFSVLLFSTLWVLFVNFFSFSKDFQYLKPIDLDVSNAPSVILKSSIIATPKNTKCTHWECFDIYKCGRNGHDKISVYIYPLRNYLNANGDRVIKVFSREYFKILSAIRSSKYYTVNPNEACLFISPLDTLNLDRVLINETSVALNTLPHWNNGNNHVIFNMLPSSNQGSLNELDLGNAIIAGADFDTYNFRTDFDISIPLFSPIAKMNEISLEKTNRTYFITSSQLNLDSFYLDELQKAYVKNPSILILDSCGTHNYTSRCDINTGKLYPYPEILGNSTFCVIFRGSRMSQFLLLEAMAARCVPVIVINGAVMPFNSVIDWKKAAIFIMEDYVHTLVDVLSKISTKKIHQMRKTIEFLYSSYFSSMEKIALTTLDVLQDRVFSHWSKMYDEWNLRPEERSQNALFLPHTMPKSLGFTAVVLTYDRVESLFTLIKRISRVPSLMKVVVVWNNQKKDPPSAFPLINKPIKVIRTSANKLSNRFVPYKEIETEAILHLDDDITMLTADELEFGYEVWREFPERIVGFPSRTHTWDNETQTWKYKSEWTNELSMVLTGAAFLHKYYSYLYTKKLPVEIRDWVDENMNCEDIAMNFLVANITNQPPIKVTPRKKFKCPECSNEMLSADIGHMVERSKCVDKFSKIFGKIPLQFVEFRADPVLFKDPFPEKLKRFNDIGSL